MARIGNSKGGKKSSSSKRESKYSFEEHHKERRDSSRGPKSRFSGKRPRSRDSSRGSRDRGFGRFSRDRRNVEMTKVICSSCGVECEVPFKPTSDKPVYCSNCFEKKEKSGSGKPSDRDFDIINEKLNKIMKALDIE